MLNDQRIAGLDRRQLAYHVLVRIPVGAVAWEEIAFRGVLQAALRRVLAEPAATVVESTVFGLWHIRPTGRTIAQEWNGADNARRREMLAEFEVRVVLHATGHEPRVAITGMEISPDGFEMVG